MKKPVFRMQAIEAQRASPFGEVVLIRPLSFSVLTGIIVLMISVALLFFILSSYSRRTTVKGVVAPVGGIVKIYPQQTGIVTGKLVSEGQRVSKGDILYTVSTEVHSFADGLTQTAIIEKAKQRRHSLQEEIKNLRILQKEERSFLVEKQESLYRDISRLISQRDTQHKRVNLAEDRIARYEKLFKEKYISGDQYQQQQNDLLDQQTKLNSYQRDYENLSLQIKEVKNNLSGLKLKHQNQLSQIERSIIDVNQVLIEIEARRELVFTAPVDGVATAVIAELGQTVDTNNPIAAILPDDATWQVLLYVPSTAIGFISEGDNVLIRYQAYPYQKFGQYRAIIKSIARTALSAVELSKTENFINADSAMFYRTTATLQAQTVMVYGKPQQLQAGMVVQADILQEKRRLYEFVLDPLISLTGKI